jgi:hypothetical protein
MPDEVDGKGLPDKVDGKGLPDKVDGNRRPGSADGKEPPDEVDGNGPLGGVDGNRWPEGADKPDDVEKLGQAANFCSMLVCRLSKFMTLSDDMMNVVRSGKGRNK